MNIYIIIAHQNMICDIACKKSISIEILLVLLLMPKIPKQ